MFSQLMPDDIQGAAGVFDNLANSAISCFMQSRTFGKNLMQNEGNELTSFLQQYNQQHPIIFDGSLNDMKWFWSEDTLTAADVKTIPNEDIQKQVFNGLDRRCQEGLLNYDANTASWSLTDHGKQTIFSNEFVSMAIKNDAVNYNNISEQLKQVKSVEMDADNKQAEFVGDKDIDIDSSESNKQPEYDGDKRIEIGEKSTQPKPTVDHQPAQAANPTAIQNGTNTAQAATQAAGNTAQAAETASQAVSGAASTATYGIGAAVQAAYKVVGQPLMNNTIKR